MDWTKYQTTAQTLIRKYGSELTLYRNNYSTFNPTTGQYTTTATVSYSIYGVIKSVTRTGFGDRFYEGSVVEAGDREAILEVSDDAVVPGAGDKLLVGSYTYEIKASLPVEPGGTALLYKVLLGK